MEIFEDAFIEATTCFTRKELSLKMNRFQEGKKHSKEGRRLQFTWLGNRVCDYWKNDG